MTRTLDRTRPFGQIYGIDEHGGVFEQDGCKFDGVGECVYEPKKAAAAKPAQTEAPAPAAPAGDDLAARRKKLEALHPSSIKKLVADAGLEPATGPGSTDTNIEMLLGLEQ